MTFRWISAVVLQSRMSSVSYLNLHRWFNPRRQLTYRLTHGPTEAIQALSLQSPVKRSTDVGAG